MSGVAPARASKSVAVTVIGLITLLLGGSCAAFGGWAIVAGDDWLVHPSKESWKEFFALGGIVPVLLIVVGVVILLLGLLELLAGVGVLLRQQWGRILTFIVAAMNILLGLLCLGSSDREITDIAIGVAQILYGTLAFVILIAHGLEFTRAPGRQNTDESPSYVGKEGKRIEPPFDGTST